MAVSKNPSSKKRKKSKGRDARDEEEIVIRIGGSFEDSEEEMVISDSDDTERIRISRKPKEELLEDELELEEPQQVFLEGEEEFDLEDEFDEDEAGFREPEEVDGEIVISLVKPPEGGEEIIEEGIVAAPQVEPDEVYVAEPVEAEVVKEAEKPPRKKRERPSRKKIAAVIIVIIIIIAGFGAYLFLFQNQSPVAKLVLNPDTASAGERIVVDASNSTDDKEIVEYLWDFGDRSTPYYERPDFFNDGKFDGVTTHLYDEPDDYNVRLTVMDDEGETGSVEIPITITELEVTIPPERIGDSLTYNVNGSVEVINNEGLYTMEFESGSFTLESIIIEYDGPMISEIMGTMDQEDGFKQIHQTLQKKNHQDLDLEGTASGTIKFGASETSIDYPINDGIFEVRDYAYIDLNTDKTIYSYTESDIYIPITSEDKISSKDFLRSYSNLREESTVLKIEDLKEDRTFRMNDEQFKAIGDIIYEWEVERTGNIKGYPSLGIQIKIDPDTKTRNSITDFEMWVWIANDVPLPVYTYIRATIVQDGTVSTLIYNSEIEEDGVERGTENIPYDTCEASSPDGHYHLFNPGYEFIDWESDDEMPGMGTGTSSLDSYTPQEAMDNAKNGSTDLVNYLSSHPGAYVIDGYYNESDEIPRWNLTYGEKGEADAYYVVVDENGSIMNEKLISVSEPPNSTSDFDTVLSFSASEGVFKEDSIVSGKAFDNLGNVQFYYGYSYGSRIDMFYPTISLTISLAIEQTPYAYYLTKDDGEFSAAVDAVNGQLIYTWDHEGNDILSMLLT